MICLFKRIFDQRFKNGASITLISMSRAANALKIKHMVFTLVYLSVRPINTFYLYEHMLLLL